MSFSISLPPTQRGTRPGEQQLSTGTAKKLRLHVRPEGEPSGQQTEGYDGADGDSHVGRQQQCHAIRRNAICNHAVSFLFQIETKMIKIVDLTYILQVFFALFYAKNMEISEKLCYTQITEIM